MCNYFAYSPKMCILSWSFISCNKPFARMFSQCLNFSICKIWIKSDSWWYDEKHVNPCKALKPVLTVMDLLTHPFVGVHQNLGIWGVILTFLTHPCLCTLLDEFYLPTPPTLSMWFLCISPPLVCKSIFEILMTPIACHMSQVI